MRKLTVAGALAGLMLPLTAAPEARAAGFAAAEAWSEGFGVADGWRVDRHPRLLGDVDGDDLADIVGFGEQGVVVALSTGEGFGAPATWVDNYSYSNGWRIDKHPRFLVDMNADGMADVVGFGNGGVYVATSTGSNFSPRQSWLEDLGYEQGWRVDRTPRLVRDVDDDGRADLVGFGDDGVFVARATEGRFTAPKMWLAEFGYDHGWRADKHIRLLGEVSGNDRPDIVGFGDYGTLLANGRSGAYGEPELVLNNFGFNQGWRVDRHPRHLGDIDGDARDDIVGFGQTGVIVATSKKTGFRQPERALEQFGYAQGWRVGVHVRALADVDGDGRLDIIGFGDDGVLVALARD